MDVPRGVKVELAWEVGGAALLPPQPDSPKNMAGKIIRAVMAKSDFHSRHGALSANG
jgi:hypothetical protein